LKTFDISHAFLSLTTCKVINVQKWSSFLAHPVDSLYSGNYYIHSIYIGFRHTKAQMAKNFWGFFGACRRQLFWRRQRR